VILRKGSRMSNSNKFCFLVFDLDGTLADTRKDICSSVNYALKETGFPELSHEEISRYVGRGVGHLIGKSLGIEDDKKVIDKARKYFRAHYAEHMMDNTELFPGVREILEKTQGLPRVIITNKPSKYSIDILQGLGVMDCFKDLLGGDFGGPTKPDPAPLRQMLEKYHFEPQETLVIGDSVMDVEMGKQGGASTCAVTYGFGKREDLIESGPDYIIESMNALESVLG